MNEGTFYCFKNEQEKLTKKLTSMLLMPFGKNSKAETKIFGIKDFDQKIFDLLIQNCPPIDKNNRKIYLKLHHVLFRLLSKQNKSEHDKWLINMIQKVYSASYSLEATKERTRPSSTGGG